MTSRLSSRCIVFLIGFGFASAWSWPSSFIRHDCPDGTMREKQRVSKSRPIVADLVSTAAAAIVLSTVTMTLPLTSWAQQQQDLFLSSAQPQQDHSSSNSLTLEQQLRQSISPPTAERPQILLPSSAINSNTGVVQGLVFLAHPEENRRPLASDILVLQVWNEPRTVLLGGAKIPVSRLRFPMQFQMTSANAIISSSTTGSSTSSSSTGTPPSSARAMWNQAVQEEDLVWIDASICPADASVLPCPTSELVYSGVGGSKLIQNLPGQMSGSNGGIRSAASVPLLYVSGL